MSEVWKERLLFVFSFGDAMKTRLAILLTVSVMFAGCATTTVNLKSRSSTPVMMSGMPDREYSVVRSFEESRKGWFTIFGLVTLSSPSVDSVIDAEMKRAGGDAVINVEIKGSNTWLDSAVPYGMMAIGYTIGMAVSEDPYTGITVGSSLGSVMVGLLTSRTYTISGDVIRYD